ncbi:DUF1236 domain-containing protein [Devosia sp. A8/3-2]|nr:DUF1236 domain-containing protein [Devosia sp. A8/3-2]
MKQLLLASVAALALGIVMPAFARDVLIGTENDVEAGATIGAGGGRIAGATVGAVLAGPLGAAIGGFAGATLGAEAGIETSVVDYAGAHPVEPIYLESALDIGYVLPPDVVIYPVETDPSYGYIYANDRVWIVDLQSRAPVQSPGYLVTQTYVDYAIANPIDPVPLRGDVVVGYVVPPDVALTPVPQSSYSYVYIEGRPAPVEHQPRRGLGQLVPAPRAFPPFRGRDGVEVP